MIRGLLDGNLTVVGFIMWFGALIVALTVHEFAHGFASYRLGDRTAKYDGRLSFNPLRHIDPFGIIFIIMTGFGWAKPVMVNPYNLRNPKQDMAIISISGPLSNFLLGFVALFIAISIVVFTNMGSVVHHHAFEFFRTLFGMNIGLGVFNMLPIPPLDGSKFFGMLLPDHLYFRYTNFRFGFFILLPLIFFPGALGSIMGPIINGIYSGYFAVINAIFSPFM
ncbi:MAG: site-2 protease family protein [Defluviitaleaceae bacterium]|nr:site-2 protease family protein [Defluviitaleaceae bacterium]